MSRNNLAITGTSGFIGSALNVKLSEYFNVIELGRSSKRNKDDVSFIQFDLASPTNITKQLAGVDVIIHCAGISKVKPEANRAERDLLFTVNTDSVISLARSAANAGVKRFIFLSSLKAMGESTTGRAPFHHEEELCPEDDYGLSKAKAEEGLQIVSEETGIEVVIIRPPLVYGPGVKGNFANLQRLACKNVPLPFGSIDNKRSLVSLHNLIDLIFVCVTNPEAANQTFLVSDDNDVSTPDLLIAMSIAAGCQPRLLRFPVGFIQFVGKMLGKTGLVDRLCGDLRVDISHTKSKLNWSPPIDFEEGIRRCL